MKRGWQWKKQGPRLQMWQHKYSVGWKGKFKANSIVKGTLQKPICQWPVSDHNHGIVFILMTQTFIFRDESRGCWLCSTAKMHNKCSWWGRTAKAYNINTACQLWIECWICCEEVKWAYINTLLTTEAKIDRALLKKGCFDKKELEIEILSWMPFKVSISC